MQSFIDILLQFALKYNSLGMAIHPLGYGGKNPLATEWQQPPRLTVDELEQCFQSRSDIITGLGFCSGHMSNGLSVLDFDEDWYHSLEHFLDCWPDLTNTGLWSTAHDRRQLILKINNLPASQTVTKFERGGAIIELRCNGANNCLPPSFHARCNKPFCLSDSYYEWVSDPDDLEFSEIEFNDLWDWLSEWGQVVEDGSKEEIPERPVSVGNIDRMVAAQEAPKAIETARKMIQTSKDGYKRNTLLRASGLLGGYVSVGVLERKSAVALLRAAIDVKPNVASYDVAYEAIEAGLDWGERRPFTAGKILSDKIEYANQQNGNGAGTTVLLPSIVLLDDSLDNDASPEIIWPHYNLDSGLLAYGKEVEWLIYGLWQQGSSGMTYGDGASGKTYLAISKCIRLACGLPPLSSSYPHCDPKKVLYFVSEGRQEFFKRLLAAINGLSLAGHDVNSIKELVNQNMIIVPEVPQLYASNAKRSIKSYLEYWNTHGQPAIDFSVIDTLHRAAVGSDENSEKDANIILENVRWFSRETDAAIEFIHHSNKSGGYRGSSAYRNDVDVMIKVEGIARAPRTVTVDKERDCPPDGPITGTQFEMQFFIDEVTQKSYVSLFPSDFMEDKKESAKEKAKREIVKLLSRYNTGLSQNQVAKMVTVGRNTTIAVLDELNRLREVRVEPGPRGAILYFPL